MLVLGILALLQILFLPGAVTLGLLRRAEGSNDLRPIAWLAFCFGLSLIANFCVVVLLTALRIYTRPVVVVWMGLEAAALVWVYRETFLQPLGQTASKLWNRATLWISSFVPERVPAFADQSGADEDRTIVRILTGVVILVLAGMAFSAVLWVWGVFINNIGTVFNSWDAIVSWNRWAVEWSRNIFPTGTGQYPQLIPANWSLTYVLTGESGVQFFAKAIMPLFFLFILLLMFDLGLEYRAAGFFIAVLLTRLMIKKFLGEFMTEGYVDIPVAFMALLAVSPLLHKPARFSLQPVLLGLVIAGGAAVTKQAGIFMLLIYPLLAVLILRGEALDFDPRKAWKPILAAVGVALLVVVPWYVYKQIVIGTGADSSNAAWVTSGIYGGAGLQARLLSAVKALEKYAFLIAFLVPALAWVGRRTRWVILLVVFPCVLVWALWFSYDTRNVALALPFVGLAGGVALGGLLEWILGLAARIQLRRLRLGLLAGLVVVALAILAVLSRTGTLLPDQALKDRQVALQKQIFSPVLNQKLYTYLEQHRDSHARILTNYPIANLPGLEENQINNYYNDFATYDLLRREGKIDYLLIPSTAIQEIVVDVDKRILAGEYELIFEDHTYLSYRFIHVAKRQR